MQNRIEEKWQNFRKIVVPAGAGAKQVIDMRAAFYAGAIIMLNILSQAAEPGMDESGKIISELDAELRAFVATVQCTCGMCLKVRAAGGQTVH